MKAELVKEVASRFLIHCGKAVWKIAKKLKKASNPFDLSGIEIGGSRGEDPKTTWEEAYETLLKEIC